MHLESICRFNKGDKIKTNKGTLGVIVATHKWITAGELATGYIVNDLVQIQKLRLHKYLYRQDELQLLSKMEQILYG